MPQTHHTIDLNTASEDELAQVPQIGRESARSLIDHRPFHSWADVDRVPGFSGGMVENIRQSGGTLGKEEK